MNDERKANVMQSLADFAVEHLDVNRDGVFNVKDLLGFLPNNAVGIALLVLDIVVLFAEYRVWDVGMEMTQGDALKAVGFILVSGLPFYLGQIMWLYPLANTGQQFIAGLFVVLSVVTSATFGFADLSKSYNVVEISRMVVYLTGAYILGLILYALADVRIQSKRLLAKTKAHTLYVGEQLDMSDKVLGHLEQSMERQNKLIDRYGPDAVDAQMARLRGKKGKALPKPSAPAPRPDEKAGPPNV
jgi:hypothetical protein